MLTKEQIQKLIESSDITQLRRIAKDLEGDIKREVEAFIASPQSDATKLRALNTLKANIQARDADIRNWLVGAIPLLYVGGLNSAGRDVKRLGITIDPPNPNSFLSGKVVTRKITVELLKSDKELRPHLNAVNQLLSDSYLDFGNTLNGLVASTEKIFNDTLKRQTRLIIANGKLTGDSVQDVASNVADAFTDKGLSAFVDKGGRIWNIDDYSEMLARTHLIRANNDAFLNRAAEFGQDVVQISSHGATDDLCAPEEGQIYSISGTHPHWPPLEGHAPVYHPNCAHTMEFVDAETASVGLRDDE